MIEANLYLNRWVMGEYHRGIALIVNKRSLGSAQSILISENKGKLSLVGYSSNLFICFASRLTRYFELF
jgi:hypothetical protein